LYIAYKHAGNGDYCFADYATTTALYVSTLFEIEKKPSLPILYVIVYCLARLQITIQVLNDQRPEIINSYNQILGKVSRALVSYFETEENANNFFLKVSDKPLNYYCFYLCQLYALSSISDKAIFWFERCEIEGIAEAYGRDNINYPIAVAYQDQSNIEKAIIAYEKVLEKNNPEEIVCITLQNLGDLYFQKNNLSKAIEYWELLLNINPSIPSIHYNLSCCYHIQGELEKADACFQMGVALFPTPEILAKYSHFLINQKRFNEALSFIEQCLKEANDGELSYGFLEYNMLPPVVQKLIDNTSSKFINLSAQGFANYLRFFCYQVCQQEEHAQEALKSFEFWIEEQLDPIQKENFKLLRDSLIFQSEGKAMNSGNELSQSINLYREYKQDILSLFESFSENDLSDQQIIFFYHISQDFYLQSQDSEEAYVLKPNIHVLLNEEKEALVIQVVGLARHWHPFVATQASDLPRLKRVIEACCESCEKGKELFNVNSQDFFGKTCLHWAVEKENLEM
ncbi:MAG: tetratricopeptide repeat protein, partial [Silvanigrellaceae bacterium]|nr:tetratricopeptide repeat protein [Silvanigrellaceae bacterium]